MPLYEVGSKIEADWDEHNGFVIRADDKDGAIKLARKKATRYEKKRFEKPNVVVREIKPDGKPRVILCDFHAG